jgi:hypothetical protein
VSYVQGGGERSHKSVERLVHVVTKIGMDRAILSPDLGEDLMDGGVETGRLLVGTAG